MGFPLVTPPIQRTFTEDDVASLDVRRWQLCTGWLDVVRKPAEAGKDWVLTLPFENSYANAFNVMCNTIASRYVSPSGVLCLYLKNIGDAAGPPQEIHDWVATVGKYVAMKDYLALSFALDYERQAGNPKNPQTQIGRLRTAAKPYGGAAATATHLAAAGRLAEQLMIFLNEMTCYQSADCVVAMPPSDPAKAYNLPRVLAAEVAKAWGREDLSALVVTAAVRSGLKNTPKARKLETLRGTIVVDPHAFEGRNVLLVDDLYQSGMSMNYCALLLLQAGAQKVYGLSCEKTCRNDGNLRDRQ